jgi:hypothetical protein
VDESDDSGDEGLEAESSTQPAGAAASDGGGGGEQAAPMTPAEITAAYKLASTKFNIKQKDCIKFLVEKVPPLYPPSLSFFSSPSVVLDSKVSFVSSRLLLFIATCTGFGAFSYRDFLFLVILPPLLIRRAC